MTSERADLSDHLTFSQRHGYEPLPEPMKLEEISDDLRREICNTVRSFLLRICSGNEFGPYFDDPEMRFIERVRGKVEKIPESAVSTGYDKVMSYFENTFLGSPFNHLLDLLETITNDRIVSDKLAKNIERLFESHNASYRLDTSRPPYYFVPRASQEQGEATRQAVETVEQSAVAPGAATHLRQAVEHLNAGRYADSIRESIHAVESVACKIDHGASNTLGPALDSLERAGLLNHRALKSAFDRLYGYTSDEEGIRHALIERDAADVDMDEAMFMYSACASFAAYLVNKHRKANGT